ncbi:MAG: BolA/IbaG family iron-sulfur metabolism protein [Deltaproteobacteria bacterium]|nr:BolA/IbaG family iron-sulfur metabolism protein [Deltaproteobacteria bacterium]
MSIELMNPSEGTAQALREAILKALPEAEVLVSAGTPGHFEVKVISTAFEGKTRVKKQQLVYASIAHLMKGENAPVHAIDRLHTLLPGEGA